jgi:hypothetical protein
MKKLTLLAMAIIAAGYISGCTSVPEHYNMTGTWKYTYEETGKDGVKTGSMTIAQESYVLKGQSNDASGEFVLAGTISETGPTFVIAGQRNDAMRNFRLNGVLATDHTFEGTFTTDQNTSGTMTGTRVMAD